MTTLSCYQLVFNENHEKCHSDCKKDPLNLTEIFSKDLFLVQTKFPSYTTANISITFLTHRKDFWVYPPTHPGKIQQGNLTWLPLFQEK
jgi:hypothetical protein